MNDTGYQKLIIKPIRPRFLEAIRATGKGICVAITCSLLTIIIGLLNWLIPSPPLKLFFKALFIAILSLFILFMIYSTVAYIIRIFRYASSLERMLRQIRKVFLASSGLEDIEARSELKYSLHGIADYQGTVNLIIGLAENSGLRPGILLDVVVSTTGEVWGCVEVGRVINKKAWAFPVDRKNPNFWGSLEDRMKSDPSPPPGIHLEPLLPSAIRELLLVKNKERKDV